MDREIVSMTIPADAGYFPAVRHAATRCAQGMGFPEEEIGRICLALEEALQGAIAFGYGGEGDTVDLVLARTGTGLRMVLRSLGLPLDEERLPQYDPGVAADRQDTTGLSFHLVRSMVDTVSLAFLGDGRREVSLLKRLPAAPPAREAPGKARPRRAGAERRTVQTSLRLAVPDDAEDIARLALSSHGTLMFNEHIYYPERVRSMLASGEMTSAVTVTDEGRIIGHGALVDLSHGTGLEELTYGFVDPGFRSQGSATKMVELLAAGAGERGVQVMVSFAVTSHVHSQRAVENQGFKECALLLAASPSATHWDGGADELPGRIGNLFYARSLGEVRPLELYPPARHRDMAAAIYAHRGVPVRMGDAPGATEPEGVSRLETEADFKEGWATIIVETYGRDCEAQVRAHLDNAREGGACVVQLLLPLPDPFTAQACGRFEDLGFFFGGVGPGPGCVEYLVLQRMTATDPGYDGVHLASDFGRELLAYIRSCDPSEG